ncbi:hypothetical protein QBC39DRAFT_262797, partial [Podospora conica]
VVSLLITFFIDRFSIFRNSYRFLIGIYAIATGISVRNRYRRTNILPLILSLYGFNFDDTVRSL